MKSIDVKTIFEDSEKYVDLEVTVEGWVRNHRKQSNFGFIDFNDGTCFKTLQVVYDLNIKNYENIKKILVGSSLCVKGVIRRSPGSGQEIELEIEMKKKKSCYNCNNFNRIDDWCMIYEDYPICNFYTDNYCRYFPLYFINRPATLDQNITHAR